jgi:hypothetical protein
VGVFLGEYIGLMGENFQTHNVFTNSTSLYSNDACVREDDITPLVVSERNTAWQLNIYAP